MANSGRPVVIGGGAGTGATSGEINGAGVNGRESNAGATTGGALTVRGGVAGMTTRLAGLGRGRETVVGGSGRGVAPGRFVCANAGCNGRLQAMPKTNQPMVPPVEMLIRL